jgi:hypothetical protein
MSSKIPVVNLKHLAKEGLVKEIFALPPRSQDATLQYIGKHSVKWEKRLRLFESKKGLFTSCYLFVYTCIYIPSSIIELL